MGSGARAGAARVPRRRDARGGRGVVPGRRPAGAAFAVIAEADGCARRGARACAAALPRCSAPARCESTPPRRAGESSALWRWRDGVVDRRHRAARRQARARTSSCRSTGSPRRSRRRRRSAPGTTSRPAAGVTPATATCIRRSCSTAATPAELARSEAPPRSCSSWRVALGGSVSGEHGTGWIKRGQLERQWSDRGARPARGGQARVRPAGRHEPGQEIGPPRSALTAYSHGRGNDRSAGLGSAGPGPSAGAVQGPAR